MIERILDNATDTSIKADQSLAKADYINMLHLPPLADPSRGPPTSFSPMNCYRSSSAMTPPTPSPAGAATNFDQPSSNSLIRSMLQQPVSSVIQPFLPFIKTESVWQRSSHLQSVTFSIDDHRLLSDEEALAAEQEGSLHKRKFP